MIILGIESSCDETAAAVVEDGRRVLSNVVSSQIDVHKKYGGVVPELAARHHVRNIVPVFKEAIEQAGIELSDIDRVAVTNRPGLVGSLLVGVNFARTAAYILKKPLFAVNHIEAHIYANFIQHPELTPPFLALVVSGGHTLLLMYRGPGDFDVLGTTVDDAVGEAYDKVAKLLGLGYPGGPEIDRIYKEMGENDIMFPRPKVRNNALNFSFSGLKTAVRVFFQKNPDVPKTHIAAAFQSAAIDSLIQKTKRAITATGAKKIVLAGGVSANSLLRRRVEELGVPYYYPSIELCTDNAAMVAAAAFFMPTEDDVFSVDAIPNLKIK